jgi:hypothetical protein
MSDRIRYAVFEKLGYALCELAFRTHCLGPFALAYRAGCWCYGVGTDAGIRCGALIANPRYCPGGDEPMYIEA